MKCRKNTSILMIREDVLNFDKTDPTEIEKDILELKLNQN